jgi:hypothetical protein
MEMMENLSGLPHSHTPPLTPITLSDFLPVRERIFYYFSPWPKGQRGGIYYQYILFPILQPTNSLPSPIPHRGAYIINIFYSLFLLLL